MEMSEDSKGVSKKELAKYFLCVKIIFVTRE